MDKLQARKHMLKMLKEEMRAESKNDLKNDLIPKKGMKVSVASDSPEGLKEGLEMAEEIIGKNPDVSTEKKNCSCGQEGCSACALKPAIDKEAIKKKISEMAR